MKHKYSVQIAWSEDDQAFVARASELPGCFADGPNHEEALKNLHTIIGEWIETAQSLGREIPQPAPFRIGEETAQGSREIRPFAQTVQENPSPNA